MKQALLLLAIFTTSVSAQPIKLAWDNASNWPVGTTVDLLINGVTYPGHTGTMATIDVPLETGQGLSAKARAVPPATALCLASATQDITLCKSATESTAACPLKPCEPSAYSNEVKADAAAVPSALKTAVVWSENSASYSIWPDASPLEALAATDDTASVNVGVKFVTSAAGSLTAIKFYKATAATGTHVATLWTASGTKQGSVTFVNESATGWQTAVFTQPVAIQANTTYVASVMFPNGNYAYTDNGLATPVIRAPLTALANGVYQYSTESTFPASVYRASNYWVDVVFTPNS